MCGGARNVCVVEKPVNPKCGFRVEECVVNRHDDNKHHDKNNDKKIIIL